MRVTPAGALPLVIAVILTLNLLLTPDPCCACRTSRTSTPAPSTIGPLLSSLRSLLDKRRSLRRRDLCTRARSRCLVYLLPFYCPGGDDNAAHARGTRKLPFDGACARRW